MNSSTEACNHPVLDKHGPPGHLPLDEPLQPTDPRIEEQAVNIKSGAWTQRTVWFNKN